MTHRRTTRLCSSSPPGRPRAARSRTWTTRSSAPTSRICRQAGGLPGADHADGGSRRHRAVGGRHARTLAGRHGLDSALAWTFDLLPCPRSATLLQVSVFVGPSCSTPPRRCWTRGLPPATPLTTCWAPRCAPGATWTGAARGEPRFMVAEPVRGFARRRLAETPLDEATRDGTRYFLNRARAGGEVVRRAWPDIAAALDHGWTTAGSTMPSPPPSPCPGSPGDARRRSPLCRIGSPTCWTREKRSPTGCARRP